MTGVLYLAVGWGGGGKPTLKTWRDFTGNLLASAGRKASQDTKHGDFAKLGEPRKDGVGQKGYWGT